MLNQILTSSWRADLCAASAVPYTISRASPRAPPPSQSPCRCTSETSTLLLLCNLGGFGQPRRACVTCTAQQRSPASPAACGPSARVTTFPRCKPAAVLQRTSPAVQHPGPTGQYPSHLPSSHTHRGEEVPGTPESTSRCSGGAPSHSSCSRGADVPGALSCGLITQGHHSRLRPSSPAALGLVGPTNAGCASTAPASSACRPPRVQTSSPLCAPSCLQGQPQQG